MSTCPTLLVILVPPAAPVTSLTSPSLSTMTVGTMDERGVLPGIGKLLGDGGTPKLLVMPGKEKSSISSFSITPVDGDRILEPKLERGTRFFARGNCYLQRV